MGRQPWSVFGLLKTSDSASPNVGPGLVATSFITLTVLYGVLAVIEVRILLAAIRKGPAPAVVDLTATDDAAEPAFAY